MNITSHAYLDEWVELLVEDGNTLIETTISTTQEAEAIRDSMRECIDTLDLFIVDQVNKRTNLIYK